VLDLHVRMGCRSTPPVAKPSNAFSIRKKLKGSKSGTKVTLEVVVPGPGVVGAVDGAPVTAKAKPGKKAKSSKKKARVTLPVFGPVSKTAKGAETVKVTLKLTKTGKAKLKKAGKVKATAKISYTPTSGDKATQSVKVTFKKATKKPAKKGKGKR